MISESGKINSNLTKDRCDACWYDEGDFLWTA